MTSSLNGAHLFKRDCLVCPPQTPSCPVCPQGKICSLVQASCTECQHNTCVPSGVTVGSTAAGPNVAAIAGGVVGGVAFITIITFLIWWFYIRPRRELEEEYEEEEWEDEANEHPSDLKSFREQRPPRDSRASVHTVHSMASSVMSRASNMIPIAFIPGVMNRDGRSGGSTTPVPPIPAARNYSPSPLSLASRPDNDAIFFSPGDLRNSAYSSTSTFDPRRTFMSRASITPSLARESLASDIYHDDAGANPMPAQQVIMTRPNMVSVAGTALSSPTTSEYASAISVNSETPRVVMSGPLSPSNYSSTTSSFVKPVAVTIGKKGLSAAATRFPVRSVSNASAATSKPSTRSPLGTDAETEYDDESQSPFADEASRTEYNGPANSRYTDGTLTAVTVAATRRASRGSNHAGLGERDVSPFADEHSIEERKP